jgi:adenylate cyclase
MAGIIQRHNGVIDKFIGDAILAFFWDENEPVAPALSASREMLSAVDLLAHDPEIKQILGEWRLDIGIGMHYGSVIMGNIGSDKKMDFTIIGTTVNIASRLEKLNKRLKTRLLVTEEAFMSLKESPSNLEFIGKYDIRGIDVELPLYTLSEDARNIHYSKDQGCSS